MLDTPQIFCKKSKLTECIENIANEEINKGNSESYNEIFLTSHLTQCPRRIVYRVFGEVGLLNKDKHLKKIKEQFFKKKWIDFFVNSKKIECINCDFDAADCHYNMVGQIDAIFKFRDQKIVFMPKLCDHDKYMSIVKEEIPRSDIIEIMMNMWLVEIQHGLILYEDVQNVNFICYHVKPCQSIISSVRDKCLELLQHKIMGTIPKRPYEIMAKECQTCEFNKVCW